MSETYTIKLPQFEGPFDLLLFFIERDELDIYDIPISKVTDDFLIYLRQLEAMNIDLASEFILVAATLMRIKAKMLLPRRSFDEEGNEIDPRQELVDRLIEYKRYKSVLEELRELESKRLKMAERGNAPDEWKRLATKALAESELESLNLFKLLKAFEQVMERFEANKSHRQVHTVYRYDYTIQQQQDYLFSIIKKGKKTGFNKTFSICKDRMHAIITFLALLELLNVQKVKMLQGNGVNNFWLTA